MKFRQGGARRLALAGLATMLLLLLLAWLGPDRQTVKRKFEHYGEQGELKIMPEVSIDRGQDAVHQLPKSLQMPPPPGVESREEPTDKDATETIPIPRPQDSDAPPSPTPDPQAEISSREQVELRLPSQSNPDWYILQQVNPEYPLGASPTDLRTSVVFVKVGIFVGPDGQVSEAMILATNGSPAFTKEVLQAVKQWVFGWRVDPLEGRWIEMTWNFTSPYGRESR